MYKPSLQGKPGSRFASEIAPPWALADGAWFYAVRLKILFVIDYRVKFNSDPWDFGLGPVINTLRDRYFAWWVWFDVDLATREGDQGTFDGQLSSPPLSRWRSFTGFRFHNQPDFRLDDYDQVWLFGDQPGEANDDSLIDDPRAAPLEQAELKLLAEWMDRGGGVLAVGDHSVLGASMCSRIPRVRSMRKWTHAQRVPPIGEGRNQTLVPVQSSMERENDVWPQKVYPVLWPVAQSGFPLPASNVLEDSWHVHPLLCGPDGPILSFPDHMHEGEVIADDDVRLDEPLDISGYSRPEYPQASEGQRPRPRVIARGMTTNSGPHPPKLFPLIGVYDGDAAGIGRIVVDSTWHHWFSYNLTGFRNGNTPVYLAMQAYYRNVALWLATPAQRVSMLAAATWGMLAGSPPLTFHRDMSVWEVGGKLLDIFGRTASQCMIHDLVVSAVPGVGRASADGPDLPGDLVDKAIVGGIGKSLLDTALGYREGRARLQRTSMDPQVIKTLAVSGVLEGTRVLKGAVAEAAANLQSINERIGARPTVPADAVSVPVELAKLRIVIERLQLPDPTDPALADEPFALTIRVWAEDFLIAAETFRPALPRIEPRGVIIELEHLLAGLAVHSGERLQVEVLAGAWGGDEPGAEALRFQSSHYGDPSGWLGRHSPGREQAWRLWYRIEGTIQAGRA